MFPRLTGPWQVYLEKKYGPGAGSRMSAALGRAGALTGIKFNAERRVHNTMRSHRLVQLATKQGRSNEMIEHIFHGYFEEGRNIADVGVLLDLAEKVRALRRSQARRKRTLCHAMSTSGYHNVWISGASAFVYGSACRLTCQWGASHFEVDVVYSA